MHYANSDLCKCNAKASATDMIHKLKVNPNECELQVKHNGGMQVKHKWIVNEKYKCIINEMYVKIKWLTNQIETK